MYDGGHFSNFIKHWVGLTVGLFLILGTLLIVLVWGGFYVHDLQRENDSLRDQLEHRNVAHVRR